MTGEVVMTVWAGTATVGTRAAVIGVILGARASFAGLITVVTGAGAAMYAARDDALVNIKRCVIVYPSCASCKRGRQGRG